MAIDQMIRERPAAVAPSAAPRPFLYNCWHVAAWADEITDNILGRKLLNIPIALFRDGNGEIVALLDACPHKFAPLSLGKRLGDRIECGYHGLQFNGAGKCLYNPHGHHKIPPNATIRSYPAIERHGAIWIWLGDRALADAGAIPDFSFATDPDRRVLRGHARVEGNYKLSVDNLMDLGHGLFLHRESAGDFGEEPECIHEVGQDGSHVWDRRLYPAQPLPVGLARARQMEPGVPYDISTDVEWRPGGLIQNHIMIAPVGQARTTGPSSRGFHCLTPETEASTHYFFANTRNYLQDDAGADERTRAWQKQALQMEDSTMVAAIQRNMADIADLGVTPVYLETDNALARVRRILESLIAKEALAGG